MELWKGDETGLKVILMLFSSSLKLTYGIKYLFLIFLGVVTREDRLLVALVSGLEATNGLQRARRLNWIRSVS